jgi:hypothetical protein
VRQARSGSRPRLPQWAVRAACRRSRGTTRCVGVVLIPAVGQGIQDVGVNDDHEVSRLPAEAPGKQLIDLLGHVGPAAVPDPDERRQGARSPVARKLAGEWVEQPEGARRLLLAEPSDKLL